MDVFRTSDEFKDAEPYKAYIRRTNEKVLLKKAIMNASQSGDFPVKNKGEGFAILDVGSGNGVNAFFLADLFERCLIEAVEPSEAQYWEALAGSRSRNNIVFRNIGLEIFRPGRKYDFVLASHVLQYIYVPVEDFIRKVLEMLSKGGEAWIVQQTEEGINQIIQHQKKYLSNSRFQNWLTFKDYLPLIKKIAKRESCTVETEYLQSSIKAIDFANPSKKDKEVLKFIFLCDYDWQSTEFKEHLATLKLGKAGRIKHPNGIAKIKKL